MLGRWLLVGAMLAFCAGQASGQTQTEGGAHMDALAGASLYADVARYASFGLHRFGSPGDKATTDWIAGELKAAGFRVEFQPIVLGRQYVVDDAHALVGGDEIAATPFWWPPEEKAAFRLTAPLVRDGDAKGKILWVDLPYDRGAYLGAAHRAAIAAAAARGPAAILLMIGNPADERFAYNVTQEDEPWPVPVMVVAGHQRAVFERVLAMHQLVSFVVAGHYDRNVAGRNVVARFGAGKGPVIVVSTPMTGWYSCVCERGPGIANFLALARTIAAEKLPGSFIFIATAGHEIGHGGMELFLKHGAPRPEDTLAWVHFGSANACYGWAKGPQGWASTGKVDDADRLLIQSPSASKLVAATFGAVTVPHFIAEKQGVGELRDVKAAGYRNFIGLAGLNRFFHTPADDLHATGPEILEPVARAFADAVRKIATEGEGAFD